MKTGWEGRDEGGGGGGGWGRELWRQARSLFTGMENSQTASCIELSLFSFYVNVFFNGSYKFLVNFDHFCRFKLILAQIT